uniref:Mediator complex subunit 27 n=1 Tax=Accipiter nisus TaxID=211598 RepID=A0A8B9M0T7_9AVES
MGVSAKRRPKAQPTTLVLPPQYVDDVINRIDRMFPEMSIQLSRPNGTSAMLLVSWIIESLAVDILTATWKWSL